MGEAKYLLQDEPTKKPTYLDKTTAFVFTNPKVYFSILILVSCLVFVLNPHTYTFSDDYSNLNFEEAPASLSDFHVHDGVDFHVINIQKDHPMEQTKQFVKGNKASIKVPATVKVNAAQCSGFKDNDRFDCFPQQSVSEDACNQRGCCWAPVNSSKGELGVPYCYYPADFKSYKCLNTSVTDFGASLFLENVLNSSYPDNVHVVKTDIYYLSQDVLRIKIYDANKARFESPFPKLSVGRKRAAKDTSYVVDFNKDKQGFNVIRKSNNQSVFNAEDVGGFIFADQLLQLSARLPSHRLYGLGQQRNDFQLDTNWRRVTLFNHDSEPADKVNLYGTHPFYLSLEDGGLSNGVFLHNSNAMDIILQPTPAITYRTIGGVLDFYFFLGPTPADVIRQYTELVGRPFMPPYWSLGFHLCRFGYNSLDETIKVWNRTRAAGIPLDTQWNDIDYMESRNDFTYDKVAFKGLPEFVNELHKEGMHYMVILDPGVSGGERPGTYPPYDEGLKEGVFIMDPKEDKPFFTKVWNAKTTVFPDFFNPKTADYWSRQIGRLHDSFPFDGLWIDMNEPSTEWSGGRSGCEANPLDNPPYLPAVQGGQLCYRTLCMSARHYNASHYDVHTLYGSQEAAITTQVLQDLRQKRPFVISRASYPGHGHFTGVWTGDISSTWDDMAHSISDILSFSLFGIPMSGADICGFNENTTVALCQRWSQLGAFYPFSRNHNSIENFDQDPVALGPEVVQAAKDALLTRYSLLPYLYTLFWHAHTRGDTVARPMFVQFPKDDKTYPMHSQFLWGPALLIAPLLTEEKSYATAYLPAGLWYDYYTFKQIESKGSTFVLTTSDKIPLLLNAGHILPMQDANTTTTLSRKNPLSLLVGLNETGAAQGDLYWDDGDSMDYDKGVYNYVTFTAEKSQLTSSIEHWEYKTELRLASITILGVDKEVTKVVVNGSPVKFQYKSEVKMLTIVLDPALDLSQLFTLLWS